jgi:acetyl-CoA synthetase
MSHDPDRIESTLHESRIFPPPADFPARVSGTLTSSLDDYHRRWKASVEDPAAFWGEEAARLPWTTPWTSVVEGGFPDARWFSGGEINLCDAAVDQHVRAGRGEDLAILWEGEPIGSDGPELRRLTYRDLQREAARLASVLESFGVKRGDVVTLYMGLVPELAIAMLACTRIGAAHSVIFGGFASSAIVDRVTDAGSCVVITQDGAWRRGKVVPLKANVDDAAKRLPGLETVIVLRRCGNDVSWTEGRDHDWRTVVDAADEAPCVPVEANEISFLLYTSGSTGKPKGIVHATGGYLVHVTSTARNVFDLKAGAGQIFWCTADLGWVTGHSYVVYGLLPLGVPSLMYEGAPDFPAGDRFWSIVERHRVTHLYTAPTAIRAFMKWGEEHPRKHDLSSLVLLGTVGEPINPEAWMWYRREIGGDRCPIVDTWWQTETGGHLITPLPGATPTVPGSCTLPYFGVDAAIVNEKGEEMPADSGGLLVIRKPWPGMLRGVHGDRKRYLEAYFSRVPGAYFTGDGARRDARGYFWIMGRVDDVINVAGHRLGTMEIESALVSHASVVEAAVVGMPHDLKGTAIAAFVTLAPGTAPSQALRDALARHVGSEIGPIARPDLIRFTDALPKTRSGKIMRRLLRDVAAGKDSGQDVTTLEDFTILARLRADEE